MRSPRNIRRFFRDAFDWAKTHSNRMLSRVEGVAEGLIMSFYRDTYLKSDHWENLRIKRIARQKGKCALCNIEQGPCLDVHHVNYRGLYDVKCTDLRGLCRKCHDDCHHVLKLIPKLEGAPSDRWHTLKKRLKRWRKLVEQIGVKDADDVLFKSSRAAELSYAKTRFNVMRDEVREQVDKGANRATMPWRDYFLSWITQMPETMNAKVFYQQWLKIERPHLIPQPGEH